MILRRYLVIFAVLVTAVAALLATYISVRSLEFAGDRIGQMEAEQMGIYIRVCNPSFVPISVESIKANLTGSSGNYGSLEVTGGQVQPLSQGMMQGSLVFADPDLMKAFVNWVINNQTDADFNSTLYVKAKVLGIIPYSYAKSYTLATFSDLLLGNEHMSCQSLENNSGSIRQDLELAQTRISATELLYSDNIGIGNATNPANSTENNLTMQGP